MVEVSSLQVEVGREVSGARTYGTIVPLHHGSMGRFIGWVVQPMYISLLSKAHEGMTIHISSIALEPVADV